MAAHQFLIIYDTYCGWCYGAAPVFEALAASGAEVRLLHRQLFHGPNVMRMADGKSAFVMQADARIGALTGQPFSDRYFRNVVQSATEVLASHFTAQAAVLVRERGAQAELALAARLQKARYVDGVSAADRDAVVAALVAEGVAPQQAAQIGSPPLAARADAIAAEAEEIMHSVGASGVPALLRRQGERYIQLDHSAFYGQPQRVLTLLER